MKPIRKFFTGAVRAVNKDRFTVDAVMSDETKDRYDEVIKADAWKKRLGTFKKHAVLLSSHEYRGLRNQIGMWEKVWVEDHALMGRAKYFVNEGNPEADWAFKLAEKGIAAFSVGFIAHEYESLPYEDWEKNKKLPRRVYTDVELLETSQVTIPANPSALMKASFGDDFLDFEKDLTGKVRGVFSVDELLDENQALDINTKFLTEWRSEQYDNSIKEQGNGNKENKEEGEKEVKQPDPDPNTDSAEYLDRSWEESENEISCRLHSPDKYNKFRRYTLKKDKPRVFGIYGKIKDSDDWETQALRFPKGDGWTMAKAKDWVKEHSDIKLEEGAEYEDISEELAIESDSISLEDKGETSSGGEEEELLEVNLEEKIRKTIQDEIRLGVEEIKNLISEATSAIHELLLGNGNAVEKLGIDEEKEKGVLISDLIKAVGESYVPNVLTNDKTSEERAVTDLLNAVKSLGSGLKEVK